MSILGGNTGLFGTPQNTGGLSRGGLGGGLTGGLGGTGTASGGGLFGNRPTGLFGNTNSGGLGTGTGGLFGNAPSSQGGGLFGNTGNTGGGLFQSPHSGLGTQQKPGGFGGTGGGGLFGQSPSLGGGLFGQSTQTSTPGGGTAGGLFNKPNSTLGGTGGGLFGNTGGGLGGGGGGFSGMLGVGQQINGTMKKFEPVAGKDTVSKNGVTQNVDTKLHCYTAMPQYDQKSLEELRFEDYQAGRKVGGAAAGMFPGSTGLGGGGLFNQNKPLGVGGLSGGGLFNQQQQQQSQLGGLGGAGGGLFNQQQKLGGGGLFNTPGQTKLGSGLNTGIGGTAGGGLFQQQTSQAGGLFNQSSGGLFNQSNTGLGALGQQQTQLGGGGLFRTPQAGGGLGGLSGGTSTLGGGIGSLQSSQTGTGLFNKPTLGGLGGLGQTQPQGGLSFGTTGTLGMGLNTSGIGTGLNTGLGMGQQKLGLGGIGNPGLGAQTGGVLNQGTDLLTLRQKQAELNQKLESVANEPFGDSPLFRTALLDASKRSKSKESSTPVSAKVTPTQASHYKLNVFPSSKYRARTLRSPAMHHDKSRLFQNLDESTGGSESSITSGEAYVPRKSIKKLIITPKVREPSPVLPDSTSPPVNGLTYTATSATPTTQTSPPAFQTTPVTTKSLDVSIESPEITLGTTIVKPQPVRPRPDVSQSLSPPTTSAAAVKTTPTTHTSSQQSHTSQLTRPPLSSTSPTTSAVEPPAKRSCGVTLVRPDYYTVPSLDELDSITDDGSCPVEGFTVGHREYGEVHFPGETDVYGMNLDQLVTIGLKEVAVYPDDDVKPPVGEGLNKKAIVKLEKNWPVDKSTRMMVRDPERLERMRYADKLKKSTTKIGATFLDYVPETGTCVFEVDHFSKYKLADDDSDEEDEGAGHSNQQGGVVKKLKTAQTNKKSQPPINQPRPLGDDDEEMSELADEDELATPTQPHPLPVLPSHHLVSSMGIDTRTLQTMKASFVFFSSDTTGHLDNEAPPIKPPLSSQPRLLRREPPLISPSSPGAERVAQRPVLGEPVVPPTQSAVFVGRRDLRVLVAREESLVSNRERNIADLGLTMGRSFRVGWGPNWTLAHSGSPFSHSTDENQPHPLKVVIEQVHVNHVTSKAETVAQYEPFLRAQLEHTEFKQEEDQLTTPLCTPSSGPAFLHALSDVAKRENMIGGEQSSNEQLWRVVHLARVLWGALAREENDSHSTDTEADSYEHQLLRKQALYQWLKQTNEGVTESEVTSSSGEHYLEAIFSLVCGQQLGAACRLAQKHSDHKLALLLSQAVSSSLVNKTFLHQQLKQWEHQAILGPQYSMAVDFLIEDARLKVYMVLAGELVWDGGRMNLCDGLDWKRVLALLLSYHCPPTALINDVIDTYFRAFHEEEYAPPPLPPYLPSARNKVTFDTCYHLLCLYCDRAHSLELTFDPLASTSCPLDYRISWLLWAVLVAMDYTHLHPTKLVQLQTGFASQLERSGLWEWAGFVLLHLSDPVLRDSALQHLFSHHCTSEKELSKQESFLVSELHVPLRMVHAAKAQRAAEDGLHELQAHHLLVAERWNDAHDVILNHLATDAIINDDTEGLVTMLEQLSEQRGSIQHWENGGSVYLDFIRVSSRIHQLTEEPSVHELDAIHMGLVKLAHRVGQLPSHSPMEILCQSELSKRTASYTRIILQLKEMIATSTVSIASSQEFAPTLSQLPMPSDYAVSEYRTLLHPYIEQLADMY